ncbi:structural constituent of cell wall [Phytophthora oleae]|uniref:Structural constituent of cell wall n=1 Tax=Phytophthora oleae TaxID=2107226 RepID=A0ABD3EUG3_9STRA
MEVPEIILQILSLREYMAQGLDASLLYCYASLMAINAFVTFYHIQFRWNEAALRHILKDSILDAAFAVFFPALILLYSLFVFQDDLKAVKIRQQFFPPRVFERKARNLINAKEMNLFSTDFESLLVRSAWDVFLKLSFSLLACFRWNKITLLLLQREHKRPAKHTAKPEVNCKTVAPADYSPGIERLKPLRSQLRTIVGSCFLVYGVGCLVYTALAVRGSQAACSTFPSCVQFASQWTPNGPNDACECLAYVDRDLAPADSENRSDVTDILARLAAVGKLQTVQLVNRRINGSLPEELQTCQSLRNLVLIHTGVQVFPAWTATSFAKLEYLHIEGESTDANLVELPSDLFASMASLHTIHVSFHANLPNLPSLTGLKTLESVYFGYIDGIKEIPSTGDLPEIQVLALEALPLVRWLPDVAQYQSTLEMIFLQDVPVCCSGFLSEGNCNTTFPTCCENDPSTSSSGSGSGSGSDSSHDPLPRNCLEIPGESNFLPSNATISLLHKFAANISNFCDAAQATCPSTLMSTKMLQENVCQGVLYRACSSESKGVGICFNEDMGPVECKYSRKIIEMRKAEIAAGCHCDKVEEQWLGCTG